MTQTPYRLDTTGADIQAEIRTLRARGPITPVLLPDDVPAWLVTNRKLMRQLMTDDRVSKSSLNWNYPTGGQIDPGWVLGAWVNAANGKIAEPDNMFHAQGADHRRLRSPARPAFAPRRITAMRPAIEQITSQVLDRVEQIGTRDGVVDLRREFAYPVPVEVIGRLIGLPDDDLGAELRERVPLVFDTTLDREQALGNQRRMQELMRLFLERKKETPGQDLTTDLLGSMSPAHDIDAPDATASRGVAGPPRALTEAEVLGTVRLMVTAGFDTTVNLLDQGIHALLTHPHVLSDVRSGQLSWPQVVEETLRFQAPVATALSRFAREDIEIGAVTIAAGDLIVVSLAAAGRDADTRDPDVFDPARDDVDHVAFGHGVHHCLGAPLARLEAVTALSALFDRFPAMEFAVDPGGLAADRGFIPNGHRQLPVRLTP